MWKWYGAAPSDRAGSSGRSSSWSGVSAFLNYAQNNTGYYWLLYYTFLSPQQLHDAEEIIEKLRPHIRDISYRTYYRKRREAIDALSAILWGYTAKDSLAVLEQFFPKDGPGTKLA